MSWWPPNRRNVNSKSWFFELSWFDVLLNQLWSNTDDMLTFPVLDHVHCLQRWDYIALRDTRHVAVEESEFIIY